ncbi:putative inhibitor of apoptosis isoform X2 [Magallana gigas]|uniref:putative inhibitor of apoptosis isoform X2 n=1 Tax=Magallana gigas TaxID=29159 RepID=UPI00334190EF
MAATVFMCSSCGMCFDKVGLFTAHNCTGSKRKPIGIGTSVEEAEDVVLEMNTTPQERRRTMFECQDCKKVFYSMDIFANHVCVQAQPSIKEESTASSASTSEGQDQGQDTDVCKICMEDENKIECAFVECGHMLACRSCASKLKSCPVCRSEIQQVLKLYKP